MMFVIVGAALALLVFVVTSYLTGGVVKRAAQQIFRVTDDGASRVECTVIPPGTKGDYNGDGINDSPNCQKYVEKDEHPS